MLQRFLGFSFIFGVIFYAAYPGWTQDEVPTYKAEVILDASEPIYGIVAGEFDGAHEGEEIAIQVESGQVYQVDSETNTKTLILDATDPITGMHTRPTLSLGDVDSHYPGMELVAAGESKVYEIYNNNGQWDQQLVWDQGDLIGSLWGARTGDYDAEHPGDEIFVIHEGVFDFSNGYIYSSVNGQWQEEWVYGAEVGMDSAAGELDPSQPGDEVIVVTEMGPAYRLIPSATEEIWPSRTIWNNEENAAWVVKVADLDGTDFGFELAYGTRYNNRILVSYPQPDGSHRVEVAYEGLTGGETERNMWDIAVGDVLPDKLGEEIVGVDNSGYVYLVWQENGTWQGKPIHQEPGQALYAVALLDLDPTLPGREILVGGQSGRFILLQPGDATGILDWSQIF